MGGCGCSNKSSKTSSIVSESILEGEFTTVDGVKFTASMTATGVGSTRGISKKISQNNVFETLTNFLHDCNPKIIDYKYEIKTKCNM